MSDSEKKEFEIDWGYIPLSLMVLAVVVGVIWLNLDGANSMAAIIGVAHIAPVFKLIAIIVGLAMALVKKKSETMLGAVGSILAVLFLHTISFSFFSASIYSGVAENNVNSQSSMESASNADDRIKEIERIINENLTADDARTLQRSIYQLELNIAFDKNGKSLNKTIVAATNYCDVGNKNTISYRSFCNDYSSKKMLLPKFSDKSRQELEDEKSRLNEKSSIHRASSKKNDKLGTLLATLGFSGVENFRASIISSCLVGLVMEVLMALVIMDWQRRSFRIPIKKAEKVSSSFVQLVHKENDQNKVSSPSVVQSMLGVAANYSVMREEVRKKNSEKSRLIEASLNIGRAVEAVTPNILMQVVSSEFLPTAKQRITSERVIDCVQVCIWESVDSKKQFSLLNGNGYISQNKFVEYLWDKHHELSYKENGVVKRHLTFSLFKRYVIPIMVDDLRLWTRDGKGVRQKSQNEFIIAWHEMMERIK